MASFIYFFFLSLNICLGTFVMGFFLTVYNPLQNQISNLYQWDDSTKNFYEGLITALIPLGAIFANFFSSIVIEKFGRKITCFLLDSFCILSTIITLFANIPCLILGRLLCGVAVGVNSVLVGIYVKEISPEEHVHFFCSMGGFMLNFGMVTSFLFGINALSEDELNSGKQDNWWRVMFGFPIAICLLRSLMLLFIFNYESPVFLIRKKKEQQAVETLEKLYKNTDKSEVLKLFEEIKNKEEINMQRTKNIKYSEIFNDKYLLRVLISLSLVFGNQYSGVNAIAFYSTKLFTNLGGSNTMANDLNGALGAVNLISGLLIAFPLKKIGVRKTYLMSCFGSGVTLGLVALFVLLDIKIISMIFIFGYYFFFSMGIGPIIFMVIPQFLPEKFVSVIFIFFWILAFIIGLTFPMMLDSHMSVDGTFLFFSCCCFATFVFNFFKLPDTSGKTAEEVLLLFEKNEDNRKLMEDEKDSLTRKLNINFQDSQVDGEKGNSSSTNGTDDLKI